MNGYADNRRRFGLEAFLIGAIIACLVMQLLLVFVHEANWDEFFYLSRIYDYQRGSLDRALQSFHVYLFGWLPWVSSDEIIQLQVGRLVMWLCEVGTCLSLYGIAKGLMPRPAALMSVAVYVSFGYVIVHGASFRADPLAAFLLAYATYTLAVTKLRWFECLLLAVLGALAFLVTLKAIFFVPVFIALIVRRLLDDKRPWRLMGKFATTGLATCLIFISAFLLHRASLIADGSGKLVTNAYSKVFLSEPFPQAYYILKGMIGAPLQVVLIVAGSMIAVVGLCREDQRRVAIVMLGMAAPLLCLTFYRNAFPYFFVFLLPPVAIVAGYAVRRVEQRIVAVLAIAMALGALLPFRQAMQQRQDVAAQTIREVHRIFPDPVPYIDRCSMIATFPKVGFFMSTWGIENYRQAGRSLFSDLAKHTPPPMVIANSPALESGLQGVPSDSYYTLLEDDAVFLRENFVNHWGAIWVAGKRLNLKGGELRFQIAIPGIYTVESSKPVFINGRRLEPEETIELARGGHSIAGSKQEAILRYGNRLYRPSAPEPDRPLFLGFR